MHVLVDLHLQVWGLNRRVKFYFFLTVIAMVVDLAIGVGGVLTHVSQRSAAEYISVTFSMRALHIALDTLVLYGALGETKFVIGTGLGSSTGHGGQSGGSGSSLRTANRRQGEGSRSSGNGGPTKHDGVVGSDCERGHRVPPAVRAPSTSSGSSKLWLVMESTPSIHHSSNSLSTPVYPCT